jgi:hypothetical protein
MRPDILFKEAEDLSGQCSRSNTVIRLGRDHRVTVNNLHVVVL